MNLPIVILREYMDAVKNYSYFDETCEECPASYYAGRLSGLAVAAKEIGFELGFLRNEEGEIKMVTCTRIVDQVTNIYKL